MCPYALRLESWRFRSFGPWPSDVPPRLETLLIIQAWPRLITAGRLAACYPFGVDKPIMTEQSHTNLRHPGCLRYCRIGI